MPEPPEFPPLIAALTAEKPDTSRAAPTTPAAAYETAGRSTVFPLFTSEVMHATLSPVSRAFSWRVAWAAISGTENAIEGIKVLNDDGITCVPVAEKVPLGTIMC